MKMWKLWILTCSFVMVPPVLARETHAVLAKGLGEIEKTSQYPAAALECGRAMSGRVFKNSSSQIAQKTPRAVLTAHPAE